MELGNNETIKQAVMAGMGIAVISAHTVDAELAEKRLVALDVKGLPINRKWFLVKHGNKRFLPSAQTLWNFIARNGKFEELPLGADGILRSETFPGLWLDPAALVNKDRQRLLEVLRQGLASPEHAAFVAKLNSI